MYYRSRGGGEGIKLSASVNPVILAHHDRKESTRHVESKIDSIKADWKTGSRDHCEAAICCGSARDSVKAPGNGGVGANVKHGFNPAAFVGALRSIACRRYSHSIRRFTLHK